MNQDNAIHEAAKVLAGASRAAVFSGAGVSAESGIPTFRDPGGVWDRLNPAEVGDTQGLLASLEKNPEKLVAMFMELLAVFDTAAPNPGHRALFDLERMGILQAVITQNIDNLHQEAGNTQVIEMHGNGFRFRCLSCRARRSHERHALIRQVKERLAALIDFSPASIFAAMPECDLCGSGMRPDVVMFGETVMEVENAFAAARACDVMLALGTSGVVTPAARIPAEAKASGAKVIVINPNENGFTRVCDIYIPMKTGQALPRIVEQVKKIRSGS
ncbi:MAG: NAD-dependent deacylase [Thermodesulfobacteriota bacterium]|nr:NAD-dependent deacylase [Thermodesulfobacteriota bacterium]